MVLYGVKYIISKVGRSEMYVSMEQIAKFQTCTSWSQNQLLKNHGVWLNSIAFYQIASCIQEVCLKMLWSKPSSTDFLIFNININ